MVLRRFGAENGLGSVVDTELIPRNWSQTEFSPSLIGRHVVERSRNDEGIYFEVSMRWICDRDGVKWLTIRNRRRLVSQC